MAIGGTSIKKCYILPSSDRRLDAINNSKWGKVLGRNVARACSGGNILLKRGKIVTSNEYKARKEKVLHYAF